MELKEFVKNSLLDVMHAVREAQQEWQAVGHKGAINPVWSTVDKDSFRDINFDVAVTAEDKSAGKIGGGIKVVGLNVGGETTDTVSSSSVSRIQFRVPIVPPAVTLQSEHHRPGSIEYPRRDIA